MTQEFPELAEFKKKALQTALGTLIQLFSQGSSEETEAILDQWGLESLKPFMDKKDDPGQDHHPGKEGYKGILKQGNGSIRGSPHKPKRAKFWDENPPVLKVIFGCEIITVMLLKCTVVKWRDTSKRSTWVMMVGGTPSNLIMPGQRTQKIIVLPKTQQGPVSKREIL